LVKKAFPLDGSILIAILLAEPLERPQVVKTT
jgi:hypothetical protein